MAGWPEIKAGIFAGESGGDYDALFKYSNRPGGQFAGRNVTGMTVDEAIQFSDPRGPYAQWVAANNKGTVATPMGAFQIVGSTLKKAKEWAGLTGNEPMTEEVQDRLGQAILANQGTGAWKGYKGPGVAGGGQTATTPAQPAVTDGPKGQEVYTPAKPANQYALPAAGRHPPNPTVGTGGYVAPGADATPVPAAPETFLQSLAKNVGKLGMTGGIGNIQPTGRSAPMPQAARIDQGDVPTIDPQANEMQRQQLAMAMQRLNSGRLF